MSDPTRDVFPQRVRPSASGVSDMDGAIPLDRDLVATRRRLASGRHTSAYLEAGPTDGPLIVLVHGWPEISSAWRHQMAALARLGFRVVAPDLRGCGGSSVHRSHEAYAQREIVQDMIDLVDGLDAERAVWVGHDWGSVVVSNLAHHHPARCIAVAGICQPFNTLERGLDALIPLLDRSLYPVQEFPAGQFEYMKFYHENFADAQASFEADVARMFKAVMRRGDPSGSRQPFITALVRKQGGWFGPAGQGAPDLPLDTAIFSPDDLETYVEAYQATGFFGVNSLYMNDADNRAYFESAPTQELAMPVLYLSGAYDFVCDTERSRLGEPMRAACRDLTYKTVASGHWMPHERPEAVNAALCAWIAARVPSFWPA